MAGKRTDHVTAGRADASHITPSKSLLQDLPLDHKQGFQHRGKLGNPIHLRQEMDSATTVHVGSGLLSVALVIKSKDGPRLVFHHPPHLTSSATQPPVRYGTELDPDEEDEDQGAEGAEDSDLEDDDFPLEQGFGNLNLNNFSPGLGSDEHYDGPNGEQVVPWEQLGEFKTTDLESILTPSRAYHKKKFQLFLDPLHFVSYPIHVREDGTWKKKSKKKPKKPGSESIESKPGEDEETVPSKGTKSVDTNDSDDDDDQNMTMFNVVFILVLPKAEAQERIAEIYEHVIKKFNKALHHAQAQSGYVWKESKIILAMKEKAREERRPLSWLWSHILLKSTLAAAIRDVSESISSGKISTVRLGEATSPIDLSLQIPIPSFLTSIPDYNEKSMPGLLLTSANPFMDDEGNEDPTHLNKHFALLLLDDKDKIISEIQADNTDLSPPLIECISICKPTLSFAQVAQNNSVDLASILILAQHLMHWRKAIAIPPLHARDMYIVSPNSDNHKLPAASKAWAKAFPLAPTLPHFLALLSNAPRAYKTFAPSKDHRPTYMDMLAWLVRGGWVTPLRTFVWVTVWPEIIYEVDYQLKAEALKKTRDRSPITSTSDSDNSKPNPVDPTTPLTTEQAAENARLERLAAKAAAEAAAEAKEFAAMPLPVATPHPSINNAAHLKKFAPSPYLIKDPHKANHEESLYLAAIGKRFTDPKVKECWAKWTVKYFNGREALESIGLREGMKRKETWNVVMNFDEYLLIVKHW
ncbi:hypothetical protein B7494_g3745 [Chlorociboria aeruginascens]|nr:hypothetical protein B7494_g3745 [Chlorociboria aeruginascens]